MTSEKRVLSGIQPSGTLHIGNYFGAIKQFLDLQYRYESFIFIANYHAMTTIKDPKVLRQNTLDVAMTYLALGLDPERVCLFKHSDIPELGELCWILTTVTPMGLLERCHSYKDKLSHGISPDHGIFAYPVLMAADILIYRSDIVPVGKDQKQHVEVSRDIAIKFNNIYGEVLKVPDVLINESTAVVPGIDGQKMSKSYNNYISVFEDKNTLKNKIMSIVTDSTPLEMPKNPDKCNVFTLYSLFATPVETEEMRKKYLKGGYGYGQAKKELLAKIIDFFAPARQKYLDLNNNRDYVEGILARGAQKARAEAIKTMTDVRRAVGL